MKGKEEASQRKLTEKEASQLSYTEFKAMVIGRFTELTENYQRLQGNCNELTANYINMKKEIETTNKSQKDIKHTMSELTNTVEENKSRSTFTTPIQHSTGSPSPSTQTRKGNKRHPNWNGGSKTVIVCT